MPDREDGSEDRRPVEAPPSSRVGTGPGHARHPGAGEVLLVGAAVVLVVLAAAGLTAVMPSGVREVVVRTPLLIGVLVVGTGLVLWRILHPPRA